MNTLVAALVLANSTLLTEFCEGYKSGYENVYRTVISVDVALPVCPVQPEKDFNGQTDFSQGYYIGAFDGLRDGKGAK